MQKANQTKYTLVVVDMQAGFSASQSPRTISSVIAEIAEAKAVKAPIVFVVAEPAKSGPVDSRLLALMADYDAALWTIRQKFPHPGNAFSAHSGAETVAEICYARRYPEDNFRICGVNTELCVFYTAAELGTIYPDATVVVALRACNSAECSARDAVRYIRLVASKYRFANFVLEEETRAA